MPMILELPEELEAALKREAERRFLSPEELVLEIIQKYLDSIEHSKLGALGE